MSGQETCNLMPAPRHGCRNEASLSGAIKPYSTPVDFPKCVWLTIPFPFCNQMVLPFFIYFLFFYFFCRNKWHVLHQQINKKSTTAQCIIISSISVSSFIIKRPSLWFIHCIFIGMNLETSWQNLAVRVTNFTISSYKPVRNDQNSSKKYCTYPTPCQTNVFINLFRQSPPFIFNLL